MPPFVPIFFFFWIDGKNQKERDANDVTESITVEKNMSNKTLEVGVEWTQEELQQKSKIKIILQIYNLQIQKFEIIS